MFQFKHILWAWPHIAFTFQITQGQHLIKNKYMTLMKSSTH